MTASLAETANGSASVSVAVVGICSAAHLGHCLDALASQENAPPFDVTVAHDPGLAGVAGLAGRFPNVRFVSNVGQRSPLELASRAIRETSGQIVLLTEDHCVPEPDWVRRLAGSLTSEWSAAGGPVEIASKAGATDWAFYFVDFFRYAPPVEEGPSSSLTVCNVAYRRADLERIDVAWRNFFHETAVNDALRAAAGPLRLGSAARVTMSRSVHLRAALCERYAFGRLFGCTRLEFRGGFMRAFYCLFAPLLPPLLIWRMARKALPARSLRRHFLGALPALAAMVLAWSLGEWLGYVTRRRPSSLTVAPERAMLSPLPPER